MQRIEFDIKYRADIEAGRYKVETRDGKPAGIVHWNIKARGAAYPAILARVKFDNYERVFICTEAGIARGIADDYDLFLVPIEQDACTITGWMARDEWEEELWFYKNKPERRICSWNGNKYAHGLLLDAQAFSSLTWADEPVEVELTIKRKEKSK